jgi:hypothetical protein
LSRCNVKTSRCCTRKGISSPRRRRGCDHWSQIQIRQQFNEDDDQPTAKLARHCAGLIKRVCQRTVPRSKLVLPQRHLCRRIFVSASQCLSLLRSLQCVTTAARQSRQRIFTILPFSRRPPATGPRSRPLLCTSRRAQT